MHIVHPDKVEDIAGWIQEELMRKQLSSGKPFSELYRELIAAEFGLNVSMLRSESGWRCGFAHPEPNFSAHLEAQIAEGVRPIKGEVDSCLTGTADLLRRFLDTKLLCKSEVDAMLLRLEEARVLAESTPNRIAERALHCLWDRAVFGISPCHVAIGLISLEMHPDMDVFLTSDAFMAFYTKSDWEYLLNSFHMFIPHHSPDDEHQMKLFEDPKDKLAANCGKHMCGVLEHILQLGPSVLDLDSSEVLQLTRG